MKSPYLVFTPKSRIAFDLGITVKHLRTKCKELFRSPTSKYFYSEYHTRRKLSARMANFIFSELSS